MDIPIKLNAKIQRKNLKEHAVGEDVVRAVIINQLIDKLTALQLIRIDANAYEVTAKIDIVISTPEGK